MRCTRRAFLRAGLAAGAAWSSWPGHLFADEAAGEFGSFTFISVNDLHFTDPVLCPPWFERAFAAMRASAPEAEFVLVSGDLTSEATAAEFGGLRDLLPLLRLPVHVTCGNHDMTEDARHELYDKFFPGRYHYAFEHRGWQFFGLNTSNGRGADNIPIRASAFTWLDENLARFDPRKPTVVFTHFPQGPGIVRRSANADELLARFRAFNVQAILNGHWHGYTESNWRDAWITTDRCCSRFRENHDGSSLKGWFVCEARDGRITRRFVTVPA